VLPLLLLPRLLGLLYFAFIESQYRVHRLMI